MLNDDGVEDIPTLLKIGDDDSLMSVCGWLRPIECVPTPHEQRQPTTFHELQRHDANMTVSEFRRKLNSSIPPPTLHVQPMPVTSTPTTGVLCVHGTANKHTNNQITPASGARAVTYTSRMHGAIVDSTLEPMPGTTNRTYAAPGRTELVPQRGGVHPSMNTAQGICRSPSSSSSDDESEPDGRMHVSGIGSNDITMPNDFIGCQTEVTPGGDSEPIVDTIEHRDMPASQEPLGTHAENETVDDAETMDDAQATELDSGHNDSHHSHDMGNMPAGGDAAHQCNNDRDCVENNGYAAADDMFDIPYGHSDQDLPDHCLENNSCVAAHNEPHSNGEAYVPVDNDGQCPQVYNHVDEYPGDGYYDHIDDIYHNGCNHVDEYFDNGYNQIGDDGCNHIDNYPDDGCNHIDEYSDDNSCNYIDGCSVYSDGESSDDYY